MARSKRDHASECNSCSRFGCFVMNKEECYGISNLTHDPKLATALGNMVVAWAEAETILMLTLACVLDSPNADMIQVGYYRIPTFEARTKFIRTLITEWTSTEFDKDSITRAINKLSQLSTTRNGWIHGVWGISKPKNETIIWDFRAPADSDERRRPIKAIDVTNHCEAVTRRATALRILIYPWLHRYFAKRHGREHLPPPPENVPSE